MQFAHSTILMEKLVILVAIIFLSMNLSEEVQSSQLHTLLRIRRILNYPPILSSWNRNMDFCNIEPNSSVTIICYGGSITQLHIIGHKGASLLPKNFSMDSFVNILVKLHDLKVLTLVSLGLWGPLPAKIVRLSSLEIVNTSLNSLYGTIPHEISTLVSLQTLILDDNMFSGSVPDWIGLLPALSVLSLRNNFFNGSLPSSLGLVSTLRVVQLSHNQFFGQVPDFSSLTNLQVLDLEDNALGPQFPKLGSKLVTLILRKNRFMCAIPSEVSSFYQLQRFDISLNKFIGPFPSSLLSLPSITYLSIAENRFTGKLFENQDCSAALQFVDLSSNHLSGNIPECLLSDSKNKVVLLARNCLNNGDHTQQPLSFCTTEALAVGILPRRKKHKKDLKVALGLGIFGGIVGAALIAALVFLMVREVRMKRVIKTPSRTLKLKNTSPGYISQPMRMGAHGLPAYRIFSLEELEEATNNFDTSAFIGEGSRGQMYKGHLKDGSLITIQCLKMGKRYNTEHFTQHIELISKLRNRHLVSALGHCFECYLDDSNVSGIFLVFEYVPNGTLRSRISDCGMTQKLTWSQRINAAIGVAKGIQFLHTGIVPGIYSNNLKITDVLLDYNLVAKISSYKLPLLEEHMEKDGNIVSSSSSREQYEDNSDVYDFGIMVLEMVVGRVLKSKNEMDSTKYKLQHEVARRSIVDSAVKRACSDQSVNTILEICARCLAEHPKDRPSIEDVLWNLQFASQVEEAYQHSSSEGSPLSPALHLRFH